MGLAFIGTLCSAHSVGVVQVSAPPPDPWNSRQTQPTFTWLTSY